MDTITQNKWLEGMGKWISLQLRGKFSNIFWGVSALYLIFPNEKLYLLPAPTFPVPDNEKGRNKILTLVEKFLDTEKRDKIDEHNEYNESEIIENLRHIRRRPEMWARCKTYNEIAAIINGMNLGTQNRLLHGLPEWLFSKIPTPDANNHLKSLPWWELSLRISFLNENFDNFLTVLDEETARNNLIDQILEFLKVRKNAS